MQQVGRVDQPGAEQPAGAERDRLRRPPQADPRALRADSRPDPARPIIAPMADTAKAPLAAPSSTTESLQRPGRPDQRRAAPCRPSPRWRRTQPPIVQARIAALAELAGEQAGQCHARHPAQHARMLQARSTRRSGPASGGTPRRRTAPAPPPARCRQASTRTRRSRIFSRPTAPPKRPAARSAKPRPLPDAARADGAAEAGHRSRSMPHTATTATTINATAATPARNRDQPARAERVEQLARGGRGDRRCPDHHQPQDRRRRRAPGRCPSRAAISVSSDVPAAPDAEPDQHEGERWRPEGPARSCARHQRRGRWPAPVPPDGQRRHPAHDPGSAPPTHVRAVAHARAQHLHAVMQGHQRARQERRQRQLDHHDAVQRGRGQHHDGAKRRLHQAEIRHPMPCDSRSTERVMAATQAHARRDGVHRASSR